MLNSREFEREEKQCADLLGMTIKEYRKYVRDTKIPTTKKSRVKTKYDNSILKVLGLSTNDLKLRKGL